MQKLKKILLATDFSDLSANAFHAAHALARDHGAELLLLYVRQPQETMEGEFGSPPPEPEPTDEEIGEELADLLPDGSPVRTETLIGRGRAAEVIVAAAREQHCDLIVMGTHGRNWFGRLLHGSVADEVTRGAPCPVMALRSSQTEHDAPPA
jgi:nucleotide-binding universal stress UspA family protein